MSMCPLLANMIWSWWVSTCALRFSNMVMIGRLDFLISVPMGRSEALCDAAVNMFWSFLRMGNLMAVKFSPAICAHRFCPDIFESLNRSHDLELWTSDRMIPARTHRTCLSGTRKAMPHTWSLRLFKRVVLRMLEINFRAVGLPYSLVFETLKPSLMSGDFETKEWASPLVLDFGVHY